VIHLLAIAGRIGVPLALDEFNHIGNNLPLCWQTCSLQANTLWKTCFMRAGFRPY
jgi:dihydroxyacid dehydratase/phosphogluconate dehydratase